MSNCLFYSKEGTSIGHISWFQASLASFPQPIRAKTGSKTWFSVVKKHALKYHRLDWYSDLSDFSPSIITISAKFEKDFTMWPRGIEGALINSAWPRKMLREEPHLTTARPVQIPKHCQNRTESRDAR